ncbi:LytR/AlgR family response regulator transcription factor [Desertivirga xinjiangensis]|uniref:LytR/AlgR family response regulator transcription factor n=1 Tax=Desertivirga xinjiangensis TaxID=539206 RepID=UPI00210A5759|nr:LytTR family DNA-binding domain-containing protein [Pedobacter xinjiangensis]
MNILIIEDEKLAVDKLVQVLAKVRPSARVIGVADSITASADWLNKHGDEPDIILMDIELADGQSFAIFDRVRIKCPVIFVTSYDEYALKAFKVNSIDYLLKPIQQDELTQAFTKFDEMQSSFRSSEKQSVNIQELVRQLQKHTGDLREYRQRFLVKHLQKLISIEVSSISSFFYEDRVTFCRTFDGKNYILDYSLDEIEDAMDPVMFFRINRGLIVSIKSVDQIQAYFGNRLAVKLVADYEREAIVSREKVNDFKKWMGK